MDRGLWTSAAVGFLGAVVMFSPLNDAGAWFSAWQRSDKQAPTTASAAKARPAIVAVKARSERRLAKAQPADARSPRKPAAPAAAVIAAKPLDPKEQLARTIDPTKRPDWYLVDPTLKRGDVLFLADKVVVFRGRKIGDLADYVPVSRTRMLSRSERRQIEKLAAGPRAATPPSRAAEARSTRLTLASAKAD